MIVNEGGVMRVLTVALLAPALLMAESEAVQRLGEAADVFVETMEMADQAIPQELLNKAHCAVIIPGVKRGAFIFGGRYGRGYMTCRQAGGKGWTAPGAMRIEGGSFGLQIGGSETDVIMLVMNERGKEKLLSSRFTLGGDASAAAGPVGRTAAAMTDLQMRAEILTWSRSRGVFAGISLAGATLRQDLGVNEQLYGRKISSREIVTGSVAPPKGADKLLAALNRYSSRETK